MRSFLFLFAVFCGASFPALAQEEQVTLQFVSFPKLANAQPVELLLGEGETIKVELPTNSLSPKYQVKRLSQWAIGKSSEGPEGEFRFESYGKAASLPSANQLILVIRKGPADADGFELIPMDNRHSGFGGGDYFFMNAAKVDIAVELGDAKFALKPRSHKLISPNPSEVNEERQYLYVYLHFRKGEEAVPFYSSTWRFSDKARSMVFFHHDPHTNQLRTHTIRDYLP